MTCIVGYVEQEKVYIGADSAGCDEKYNCTIRKDAKVFQVGEFLIGGTTSFRMLQLLRFKLELPPFEEEPDIYRYMCTTFIDKVRQCFMEGGFIKKDDVGPGGTFLVGVRGRLFIVYDDYQVGESIDSFESCGCGEAYAKGAMKTMENIGQNLIAQDRITLALEIAAHFSSGVKGPFLILNT